MCIRDSHKGAQALLLGRAPVLVELQHEVFRQLLFLQGVKDGEIRRPVRALPNDDALRVSPPYGIRKSHVKGHKLTVIPGVLLHKRLVEQVEARHSGLAAVSCGEHLPERAQFVLMFRAHEEFGQIPLAVVYVLPRLPAGGGVHVEYRIYPMPPAPTDAVVYLSLIHI